MSTSDTELPGGMPGVGANARLDQSIEALANALFHEQPDLGSVGSVPGLDGAGSVAPLAVPAVPHGSGHDALHPPQLPAANVPGAVGTAPGSDASAGGVPDAIRIDGPPFTVPQEVDLVPAPRALHEQIDPPSLPEGIEHDNEATKPYWLQAKATGVAAEAASQPIAILPMDTGLESSQVVENLPDPPKRPPPRPPSNEWMIGKFKAMSGQEFVDGEKKSAGASAPAAGASGGEPALYWMPTNAGVRQGPAPAKANKPTASTDHFDVDSIRKDFPILAQKVNGKPLAWLDNAATTQKPRQVIERISRFYETENSNVHRAAHELAGRATDAYEHARERVRVFLGASSTEELIFTRGTTESINLVAQTFGKTHLGEGDEIIVSEIEHHSNIVPWQHLTRETGARIVVAPIHDNGEIDLGAYERLFSKRTRMVAITHVSNALGTIVPVQEMVATAHRRGVPVLVDGAQSTPHFPVNVRDIDADFYVMSGHKVFGPTGIGVLYGKKHHLEEMPPWQGGGNMIESVSFEKTTYNPPPYKFEAGTAILAGAVGLGAAVDYMMRIGMVAAARYEDELLHYAQDKLAALPGVRMIGTAKEKAGVLSFVSDKVSPGEMGDHLNAEGIAVRTGHHCAQPALAHYGLKQTIRPSIAFYNTRDEIDRLVHTVKRAIEGKGA